LGFVAPFGDVALAGYALTRRLEMFANFGSQGLGQASGIMVGQNLGAGRPDRAKQAVGWGIVFVNIMKLGYGLPMLIFPVVFISIFTNDQGVKDLTANWMRLQIAAAFLLGSAQVFQQSYNHAGDTVAPMIGTLIAFWAIELPLAWLLLKQMDVGPIGIGYAAIAGSATRLLFYVPYFFWGRWLKVRVI
jgi:Na+-driven multidrug efflux pump